MARDDQTEPFFPDELDRRLEQTPAPDPTVPVAPRPRRPPPPDPRDRPGRPVAAPAGPQRPSSPQQPRPRQLAPPRLRPRPRPQVDGEGGADPTAVEMRPVARPAPRPRPGLGPRRAPRSRSYRQDNFWRRHFWPPSAFGGVVIALTLAVVVSFFSTLIYASVDAHRPLAGTPTTVAASPVTTRPTLPEERPTTTRVPQALSDSDLATKVAASVRGVSTRDEQGLPVSGTAFVVGTFGGQTYLLTSFNVVRASTKDPGPGIMLDGNRPATLWTWQENKDLALLVVSGSIESLPFLSGVLSVGDKIFIGGAGQKLAPGIVNAVSDTAIEHNIFMDDVKQGAPLVNQKGEVVAMASEVYNPNGTATDTRFIGVPIRAACDQVLRCGSGNTSATAVPESPTTTARSGTATTTVTTKP